MHRESRKLMRIAVTRLLFVVNAALWLVLGATTLLRMGSPSGWILAVLMWGNSAILCWLGWKLATRRRRFWLLGLGWIALNAVLSVTDQLGWLDWLCLLLNATTILLLSATRALYGTRRTP